MTTIRSMTPALAVLFLGACLQGCVQTTPQFDKQFSAANRANLAAQVLDPAAAANARPATGIDGQAAKGAHDRYQRSFVQPDPEPAPIINTNSNGR